MRRKIDRRHTADLLRLPKMLKKKEKEIRVCVCIYGN